MHMFQNRADNRTMNDTLRVRRVLIGCVMMFLAIAPTAAFFQSSSTSMLSTSNYRAVTSTKESSTPINPRLFQTQGDDDKVELGSSEYYKGFMNRPLNEEPAERISGDAILGPTLKFVGGSAAVLVVLTFGFLASNGLI